VTTQHSYRERLLVTLALLVCLLGVAAFPDLTADDLSPLQGGAAHIGISPARGASSIYSRASSKLRSLFSSQQKRSSAILARDVSARHSLCASGRVYLSFHNCAGSTAYFAGAGRSPPASL
jgi:hypothetical protein